MKALLYRLPARWRPSIVVALLVLATLSPGIACLLMEDAHHALVCMGLSAMLALVVTRYWHRRQKQAQRFLAESAGAFRSLMECAPDAVLVAGAEGRIAAINTRAEAMFGVARSAAAGMPLEALLPAPPDDAETSHFHVQDGAFPAEIWRTSTPAGQHIAIVRDLSERRRMERALDQQLSRDPLTGLPNRRGILEILDGALAGARRERSLLAVLVFDIDAFRKINSSHGYACGDEVLCECTARLSGLLGARDALARHSGNEFIVVQAHSSAAAAARLAEAMLACMRRPFALRGQETFLSASIGIALSSSSACAPPQLVQMAQVAMAAGRVDGPARLCFHRPEMDQVIRDRVDLESMLRHAIRRGQLALQYQPRIDALEHGMVGVEALVRWRHPVLGLVAPARFIPIAEETGMIEELDMWVLQEACHRAARWRADGLPLGRISVNLSARQFQQAGLPERVRMALDASGLEAQRLELEITESTVMHDTEKVVEVLRSLKALGVALSIDDFGTGYSSLSYLKRFPLDILKIDRAFVKDVASDPGGASITRAIIDLAHGLGLEAVAEGVETEEQLAFLMDNGCDEFQGYYFSAPVWPEQIEQLLLKEAQGT